MHYNRQYNDFVAIIHLSISQKNLITEWLDLKGASSSFLKMHPWMGMIQSERSNFVLRSALASEIASLKPLQLLYYEINLMGDGGQ